MLNMRGVIFGAACPALIFLSLLFAQVPGHAQAGDPAETYDSTPAPPVAPVSVSCAVLDGVGFCPNIPYSAYESNGKQHDLLVDLYLPPRHGATPPPVLLYVHGGGWIQGSKDNCPGMTFAHNGYGMACVEYRLAPPPGDCQPERIFPAQIHDVKAAVRWLRAHAGEFGLDPGRIGALGDSSGGHLAALLATSGGVEDLRGYDNLRISDDVQAVVDWYGPVDVTQGPIVFDDDPCHTDIGYLSATYGGEGTPYFYWTMAWASFLGGSLADPEVLDRATRATPLAYIDPEDPPFLIIHGDSDDMVPVSQSELLADSLQDAGAAVTLIRLPDVGHSYAAPAGAGEGVSAEFLEPTLAFFDEQLGFRHPAPSSRDRLQLLRDDAP